MIIIEPKVIFYAIVGSLWALGAIAVRKIKKIAGQIFSAVATFISDLLAYVKENLRM